MRVNARLDAAGQPLAAAATDNGNAAFDFQSILDAAKKNLDTQKTVAKDTATSAAYQEIEDYLKKGPIVYMRDQILKEMGLSQDDLDKMPPEQRAAVEQEIAEKIKERLLARNSASPQTPLPPTTSIRPSIATTGNRDRSPFDDA